MGDTKTYALENQTIVIDHFLLPVPSDNLVGLFHEQTESYLESVEWKGKEYKSIRECNDAAIGIAKKRIEETFHCPAKIEMAYFRLEDENHKPTSWIHADSMISKNAMVLYLGNPPLQGTYGTAFWRHRIVGDILDLKEDLLLRFLEKDAEHEDAWQLTDVIGYKFNRAVFYRTNRFHSRYPYKSFGGTFEEARKTMVVFFDFVEDEHSVN